MLPSASEARLTKQRDVVAHWQLCQDGLGAREIDALVDSGVFRRLPGRILTTSRSPLELDARRWSGLLSGGPNARLTGASVLALAGIRERAEDDVRVVVPGAAARKCAGVRRYRTNHLPPEDLKLWGDLPGTSVARALVDAAADATVDELSDDLDRAVMLGLYDATAVLAARQARPRLVGLTKLDTAIATLDETSGQFRSVFERRTTRLVQRSTVLPPVVVNVIAHGYRPDIHPVGTAAIIECDGRDYHRSPAQILADDAREERLWQLGYFILRLRWAQVVYEPERTLARIERFVLEHAAPPVPRRA